MPKRRKGANKQKRGKSSKLKIIEEEDEDLEQELEDFGFDPTRAGIAGGVRD